MFYFAWADAQTEFDAEVHSVEDESIYSFEIIHTEGDFPGLTINIRNPRQNLLSDTRKTWAWLSADGTPLFYGRLVAIPDDVHKEIVQLTFVAKPFGYDETKAELADSLKVAPYWSPIWIDERRRAEPDTVLEARAELWHIDRVTHELTTSNITIGEDGTIDFDDDYFYDSLKITKGAAPLRSVTIKTSSSYQQEANGTVNLTAGLVAAFGGNISSFTGQGLESDWPKPNQSLNGGWTLGNATLSRADGISKKTRSKKVKVANINITDPDAVGNKADGILTEPAIAEFFIWDFHANFPVTYDVSRQRNEAMNFTLYAETQPVFTDPEDSETTMTITLSAQGVGAGDNPPVGDVARNSFMLTDTGLQATNYLAMLARAHLLARARAVNVEFEVPFADGMGLSLRKSAHIVDPRLPNGDASGKIIEYRLRASGEGQQRATVVMGCTIGKGTTATGAEGDPVFAESDYVGNDYQLYDGAIFVVAGDVTYGDYRGQALDDDGLNLVGGLDPVSAGAIWNVSNPESVQAAVLNQKFQDIPAAIEALNQHYTEVELTLSPISSGPFNSTFNVNGGLLFIPATILL